MDSFYILINSIVISLLESLKIIDTLNISYFNITINEKSQTGLCWVIKDKSKSKTKLTKAAYS